MERTIEIAPLTRVEGHGRVRVVYEGKHLREATLTLCESPRLFEALVVGRHHSEIPDIVCRICSICSATHRIASLMAIENAFGIDLSPRTALYRELILHGGQIESHALHLFCLILPDLLGLSGFAEVFRREPELMKEGLTLKALGNSIQEAVGGRAIHPFTLVAGGLGSEPTKETLATIRSDIDRLIPAAIRGCDLFRDQGVGRNLHRYRPLALKGGPALFGDCFSVGKGLSYPVRHYREYLRETGGTGNAKACLFDGAPVLTGAAARRIVRERIAGQESGFDLQGGGAVGNSAAQGMELLGSLHSARKLIDRLIHDQGRTDPPERIIPAAARGTAAVEAPRGILIHSYLFDEDGYCRSADIVTPTAVNSLAMEREVAIAAESLAEQEENIIRQKLEMLIREFDPCISCAVHILKL